MQDTRMPDSGVGSGASPGDDETIAQPGTGYSGTSGAGSSGAGAGGADSSSGSTHGRSNAFDELEAKIESALEDLRPKLKQMAEGMGDRVNAARESAQPRLDQLVAGMQPRIDSLLQKMQAGLDDIRRDLEERATRARQTDGEPTPGDGSQTTHVLPAGDDETRTTSSPPLM